MRSYVCITKGSAPAVSNIPSIQVRISRLAFRFTRKKNKLSRNPMIARGSSPMAEILVRKSAYAAGTLIKLAGMYRVKILYTRL